MSNLISLCSVPWHVGLRAEHRLAGDRAYALQHQQLHGGNRCRAVSRLTVAKDVIGVSVLC